MKTQTMNKNFTLRGLVAILAINALGTAVAEEKERDPREFNYLQLSAGVGMSSSADVNVGLGSGVQLPGSASYSKATLGSIILGRQFLRDENEEAKQKRLQAGAPVDPKQDDRQPMRLELELFNALVTRDTINVATATLHPHDSVKPRAVLVNLAIPIGQSDERYTSEDPKRQTEPLWRIWAGAGLGYADVRYPSASAISGCNCLREASGNGLAFQLKLQAERQVGENTFLFAQVGRVWLPAVTTTQGAQQTEYGRWGINNLMVGVRLAISN